MWFSCRARSGLEKIFFMINELHDSRVDGQPIPACQSHQHISNSSKIQGTHTYYAAKSHSQPLLHEVTISAYASPFTLVRQAPPVLMFIIRVLSCVAITLVIC